MPEAGPHSETLRRHNACVIGGGVAGVVLAPVVEILVKDLELPLRYGPVALGSGLGFVVLNRLREHLIAARPAPAEPALLADYVETGQQG